MKGITKAIGKGNYTLSGKQKKMPGAKAAPKFKPPQIVDKNRKIIPSSVRTKITRKKSSRA